MTIVDDIHYQPLVRVAAMIQRREVSPLELTQVMLARIETLDPGLRSYTTVTADLALDQARLAEREIADGRHRGPLHGVPVAVKDLCFTKDIVTTGGMAIHAGFKPDRDATVVRRLAEAGAVLLGKLHMTEGATLEHHPEMPEPVNPWLPDLWTGVSSSGSGVAAAAGLAYATIGSDTGGSIRFPSACNGLTGVKPSWGLVSRAGIFDLAATFDHLGPMARSAADCAAMLKVLAGLDPDDPTTLSDAVPDYPALLDGVQGARGVRLGFDWDFAAADADPAGATMLQTAFETLVGLGALPREVRFPAVEPMLGHTMPLTMIELAAAHETTFAAQPERYGEWISDGIRRGRAADPVELGKGMIARRVFTRALRHMFDEVDVFILPVFRRGTPTWEEVRAAYREDFRIIGRFTSPFNASGTPTVTLPCGFTKDGRPVAFQLAGPQGSEALLLRVAHAYQQATDWHTRHPPGFH